MNDENIRLVVRKSIVKQVEYNAGADEDYPTQKYATKTIPHQNSPRKEY